MWKYLLKAILTGILCHFVYREWNRRQPPPTPIPKLKDHSDDVSNFINNKFDAHLNYRQSLPKSELYLRNEKESEADMDLFIESMENAGRDPVAEFARYREEANRCAYVFQEIVPLRHPSNQYYDRKKFNKAIRAVSIESFLSTAVEFCREAILISSHEIVSVGCGDGTIEREVIAAYRKRFDSDIKITLVDPAHKVDYKVVPELIEKRPEVVGNCALLIIWPEVPQQNDGYDIDAIRKLRPRAVLTVYASSGQTGSADFQNFLRNDSYKLSDEKYGMANEMAGFIFRLNKPKDENNYGVLDDYEIDEIAREEIHCSPFFGTDSYRMLKLTRIN